MGDADVAVEVVLLGSNGALFDELKEREKSHDHFSFGFGGFYEIAKLEFNLFINQFLQGVNFFRDDKG